LEKKLPKILYQKIETKNPGTGLMMASIFLSHKRRMILLVMVIILWLNVCGTQIKQFQISMYKRWVIVSITWMIHG
jgi:hypothetical protein